MREVKTVRISKDEEKIITENFGSITYLIRAICLLPNLAAFGELKNLCKKLEKMDGKRKAG